MLPNNDSTERKLENLQSQIASCVGFNSEYAIVGVFEVFGLSTSSWTSRLLYTWVENLMCMSLKLMRR